MHSALASSRDADDVAQARLRIERPDKEPRFPAGVSGVIGRSANRAIPLAGLTRYTTGLQIELANRCHVDPDFGARVHSTVDAGQIAGVAAIARRIGNGRPAEDQPVLTQWAGGGREWSTGLWLTP